MRQDHVDQSPLTRAPWSMSGLTCLDDISGLTSAGWLLLKTGLNVFVLYKSRVMTISRREFYTGGKCYGKNPR